MTSRTRAEEMEGTVYIVVKVAQKNGSIDTVCFQFILMMANDKLRSMIGNAFQIDGNL